MWKKVPWGIMAGICAMVVFFATVGVVVAFVVLNSIAGQTSMSATLFGEWYQTVLFLVDVLFFVGLVVSLAMWLIKQKKVRRQANENL